MRLIDAEAIDYDDYWHNKGFSIRDCQKAQQLIQEQPAVDVVEQSVIDKVIERMNKYARYFDDMGRMAQSGAVRYTIMILKDELDI